MSKSHKNNKSRITLPERFKRIADELDSLGYTNEAYFFMAKSPTYDGRSFIESQVRSHVRAALRRRSRRA